MMLMKVVLLGAPGVGKGTAAKMLAAHYGLPHISTGDVLRENISRQTQLGLKAKDFIDSGKLVPDGLVTEMVESYLKNASRGFFLDGYPRNVKQANALKSFSKIDHVLNFSAPKKIVVERLSGRRTCRKCNRIYHITYVPPKKENLCDNCGSELHQRSDETPEVIAERLAVYEKETKPLIDFYRNEGTLKEIDATRNVKGVVRQCIEALS